MALEITSTAFKNGESIPKKYTCDGEDINPHLSWSGAPEKTKSFVLIFDDPDAPVGTWDHWLIFNIPATTTNIKENSSPQAEFGKNSFGRTEHGGPCPPDKEHRYFFKLYALDQMLTLSKGSTKKEIEDAMKGHILEKAQLIGKYDRKR